LKETVAIFSDNSHICLRCLTLFQKDGWIYHQKKIRFECLGFASNMKLPTPAKTLQEDQYLEQSLLQTPNRRTLSPERASSFPKAQTDLESQKKFSSRSLFSENNTRGSEKITVVKQLSEKEELMMHFLDIMHSHSRIIILHWIDNNTRINKVYLQEFFVKYLKITLDKLKDIIKVPTFDFLTEKKKMKWR
jgi:hypothetical protein